MQTGASRPGIDGWALRAPTLALHAAAPPTLCLRGNSASNALINSKKIIVRASLLQFERPGVVKHHQVVPAGSTIYTAECQLHAGADSCTHSTAVMRCAVCLSRDSLVRPGMCSSMPRSSAAVTCSAPLLAIRKSPSADSAAS